MKIPKFVKILSIFLLIIALLILYMRFIATSGLKVKEYKVVNNKIPDQYYGLKIVQFSDIHYNSTINYNNLKNIVDKINYINPDIVIFTGDIFSKDIKYTDEDIKNVTELFKSVKASYKKYAIIGSEEENMWKSVINNSDFIDLNNSSELIYFESDKPLLITNKNDIELKNDIYSILITYKPTINNKFDLILAGQTHGGQIKLPLIGSIIRKNEFYNIEHKKDKKTDLYISTGLGCTKYNFRLFNHPSINFYRLTNKG